MPPTKRKGTTAVEVENGTKEDVQTNGTVAEKKAKLARKGKTEEAPQKTREVPSRAAKLHKDYAHNEDEDGNLIKEKKKEEKKAKESKKSAEKKKAAKGKAKADDSEPPSKKAKDSDEEEEKDAAEEPQDDEMNGDSKPTAKKGKKTAKGKAGKGKKAQNEDDAAEEPEKKKSEGRPKAVKQAKTEQLEEPVESLNDAENPVPEKKKKLAGRTRPAKETDSEQSEEPEEIANGAENSFPEKKKKPAGRMKPAKETDSEQSEEPEETVNGAENTVPEKKKKLAGKTKPAKETDSEQSEEPDEIIANSIYEFTVKDINGEDVSLEKYKGNVCIIVNVASKCGHTKSNYEQFVELYDKYSEEKGLRILAFPCNQFGKQEPGDSQKILEFVTKRNVKFDMFEKIEVNGKNAHPLWQYLKSKIAGPKGNDIEWNFTKFIVDKEGKVVERHKPTVKPLQMVEFLENFW
ncbi:unnamed protein product [Acanthoscelides obtectus]|uniref:Glutathione peroxidase n=1 Tax=Acanthoscelides obtectus TaxID=200917 RepID=A0A9P0P467_ACAOB|nr:unnamed protein product [Acanthoscelides obtectus]CAK1657639.1 Phospholipid hydroperoxide glutathione peroxidase [Acanthoscelides obtectus]